MDDRSQLALPADVPPALRAAVEAAIAWLRALDEAAESGESGAGEPPPTTRPR